MGVASNKFRFNTRKMSVAVVFELKKRGLVGSAGSLGPLHASGLALRRSSDGLIGGNQTQALARRLR